jgi:hypothetical protein
MSRNYRIEHPQSALDPETADGRLSSYFHLLQASHQPPVEQMPG